MCLRQVGSAWQASGDSRQPCHWIPSGDIPPAVEQMSTKKIFPKLFIIMYVSVFNISASLLISLIYQWTLEQSKNT